METFKGIGEWLEQISIPDALLGLLVGLLLNSIARSWKYAKELNKYRIILLEFITKVGASRTKRYLEDADTAIKVITCSDFGEHKKLCASSSLDALPMLNSDVFRNIPMPVLKDVLYAKGLWGEIFTFYHCIDYIMEKTPRVVYESHVEFVNEHLKEKELTYIEEVQEEFASCQVLATRRTNDQKLIEGRRRRAELNLVFFQELQKELSGPRLWWSLKYFCKTII